MVTDGGQLFSIDLKSGQWSIYATHGTGFTAFACSEGASGIVTATRSGHVQYWDLRTPIHVRQNNLIANHVAAGSDEMFPLPPASIPLCLDMDERRVVAGTDAGDILEWDRRQTTKHLRADHLHEDAVCDVRCLRSTDGYQQIASCGMDGRVYFGSTANDLGPVARGGPGADFAMSMDVNQTERLVAFGGDAGLLYVHKL
jgi:WD40 repeat protein